MHDCPGCEAPLHDHETVCPRCGEKQFVNPAASGSNFSTLIEQPSRFNPLPMLVVFVIVGGGLFFAAQQSWIGKLIMRGPIKEDAAVSQSQARQTLEEKIQANLAAVKAKGKLTWKQGDQKAERESPQPVELDIETQLADPKAERRLIVDPVKNMMDKANVVTIILSDTRAHASWTYSLGPSAANSANEADSPP
jgi:hypothetical protein